MSPSVAFLEHLLNTGEAVMHARPILAPGDRPSAMRLLEAAHAQHRLDVAGPLLTFDPAIAYPAAEFLVAACWFLVENGSSQEMEKSLNFPGNPLSPEGHLSADVCLRLLSTVYRRVKIRPPDDRLHGAVVDVLRRWPLSGAATDVADPPIGDLHFHGHHGLQLLYAERLAANLRPAWIPPAGRTREALELVLFQKGKALPPPTEEGTPA